MLTIKIVAVAMLPGYLVEDKGFRQLMGFIVLECKVPSHQGIMRLGNTTTVCENGMELEGKVFGMCKR